MCSMKNLPLLPTLKVAAGCCDHSNNGSVYGDLGARKAGASAVGVTETLLAINQSVVTDGRRRE